MIELANYTYHPPRTMMEVYQSLPEGTRVQLISNQLILTPSPTDTHQRVLMEVVFGVHKYLEKANQVLLY